MRYNIGKDLCKKYYESYQYDKNEAINIFLKIVDFVNTDDTRPSIIEDSLDRYDEDQLIELACVFKGLKPLMDYEEFPGKFNYFDILFNKFDFHLLVVEVLGDWKCSIVYFDSKYKENAKTFRKVSRSSKLYHKGVHRVRVYGRLFGYSESDIDYFGKFHNIDI